MTGTAFSPFIDGGEKKSPEQIMGRTVTFVKGTRSSDFLDLFVVSLSQE